VIDLTLQLDCIVQAEPEEGKTTEIGLDLNIQHPAVPQIGSCFSLTKGGVKAEVKEVIHYPQGGVWIKLTFSKSVKRWVIDGLLEDGWAVGVSKPLWRRS